MSEYHWCAHLYAHQIVSRISNYESTDFLNKYLVWFLFQSERKHFFLDQQVICFLFQLPKMWKNYWKYTFRIARFSTLICKTNCKLGFFLKMQIFLEEQTEPRDFQKKISKQNDKVQSSQFVKCQFCRCAEPCSIHMIQKQRIAYRSIAFIK